MLLLLLFCYTILYVCIYIYIIIFYHCILSLYLTIYQSHLTIFNYISFYHYISLYIIIISVSIYIKHTHIYTYVYRYNLASKYIVGQGPSVSFIGTLPNTARGWLRPAVGSMWRGGPPSCGSNPTTTRRRTSTKGVTNTNGFLTWINLNHLKGEYHIYIYIIFKVITWVYNQWYVLCSTMVVVPKFSSIWCVTRLCN